LPATLSGGTMGVFFPAKRFAICRFMPAAILLREWAHTLLAMVPPSSLVIDLQPPAGKHHTPRLDLVHQSNVMGGNYNRGPHAIKLNEQSEQAPGKLRIDIPCGLVRQ